MVFGRVLRTGLSRLRRLAAARLAPTGFNPSRCHSAPALCRTGVVVQSYIARATGDLLRPEQINDLIAIVELHCYDLPIETQCEGCLDARPQ